jgi:hypothetical protein
MRTSEAARDAPGRKRATFLLVALPVRNPSSDKNRSVFKHLKNRAFCGMNQGVSRQPTGTGKLAGFRR